MKKLLVTSLTCLMMISCNQKENPLLSEFSTPFGVPPFEQIKPEHYMPAFEEGIRQHDAEIAAIIANPETPTFKNISLLVFTSWVCPPRKVSVQMPV